MKIAISTEKGYVSPHFGRCPQYTIVEIEGKEIKKKEIIENPGHQPGFIPQFLYQKGVNCVICGGMGPRAESIFKELGIKTIVGVSGKVDDVIEKFLNGKLEGAENLCSHEEETGKREITSKKICITSEGEDLNSFVDQRFGRCPYFIFVDSESMKYEVFKNPSSESPGGAGVKAAQIIIEKGANVVITGNIGPNAFEVLKSQGIEIITEFSGRVKEAIEKYKKGELKSVNSPNVNRKFECF